MEDDPPALRKAPQALMTLAIVVALLIVGIVVNVRVALFGCLLMGLFDCAAMAVAAASIDRGTRA